MDAAGSSCALPLEIILLANTFPLTSIRELRDELLQKLSHFLPPASDAWSLVNIFYQNASWLFNIIPKEEFVETIFSNVYAGTEPTATGVSPHDLGIMFSM